jgi:hypothetical protein
MVYLVGKDSKGRILTQQFNAKGQAVAEIVQQLPDVQILQAIAFPGSYLLGGVRQGQTLSPYLALTTGAGQRVAEISVNADLADAVLGPDSNAYVLLSPGTVLVVNARGQVVRTLDLPVPEAGMTAKTLAVTKTQLAVSFSFADSSLGLIALFGLDGSPAGTFKGVSRGTQAGQMACYDGTSFIFLEKENKTMHVFTAPR